MAILPPRGPNSPIPTRPNGPIPMPRRFPGQQLPGMNMPGTQQPSFREAYPAAVQQTGQDYSSIMKAYQDLLSKIPSMASTANTNLQNVANTGGGGTTSVAPPTALTAPKFSMPNLAAPERTTYEQSPDLTNAMKQLEELARTGGYTDAGISEMRARGVSPIRSVYANAMRNMDRSRSLSGGYSPNAGAATSRMARELSETIAGQTSNVNADIAEKVAAGRLSAAPQFGNLAQNQTQLMNEIAKLNADNANRFSLARFGAEGDTATRNAEGQARTAEFNASQRADYERQRAAYDEAAKGRATQAATTASTEANRLMQDQINQQLAAIQGMTNLYGTTPALANTFGNQALNAANLEQRAPQRPFRGGGMNIPRMPGMSNYQYGRA